MKILRIAIASISLLLITSLLSVKEVRAEEVKKDQKSVSQKQQNQKIKYTKEQEQTVLKKIEELNKNPKLNYNYLTKEEQLIRLDMMKKKKEYNMGWYRKLGIDITSCANDLEVIEECTSQRMLGKITQDQVISILINYDDFYDEEWESNPEFNGVVLLENFILSVIIFGIKDYVDYAKSYVKPHTEIYNKSYILYNKSSLTGNELIKMTENKIILNRFRKCGKDKCSQYIANFTNKLNSFFNQ